MEYSRILENKNTITSIITGHQTNQIAENFSIRFVFNGNENCSIGRRQLTVHSDSFLIINKGTAFASNNDSRNAVSIFSIGFDDDFLQKFNARYFKGSKAILFDPAHFDSPLCETIYPFKDDLRIHVESLKDYLENNETADELLINEYLHKCLLCCYRVYNEEVFQKAKKLNFLHLDTRMEILRRLNLAKEYLYTNYDKNINLESLANYACLSVNHLLRTFKLAYNQSPHQFLIQIRLQRAQSLLSKTEYPVYEIVNMVGFKCTSSFIRLFRNRYQTTPLKYRNIAA